MEPKILRGFFFFSLALFSFFLSPKIAVAYGHGVVVLDKRVSFEVLICQKEQEYTLGLGNRVALPKNQAMLFPYFEQQPEERLFWMKGMLFALDILWIRDGRVVHIEKRLAPASFLAKNLPLYGRNILADAVLEVNANLTDQLKIEEGQSFEWKEN